MELHAEMSVIERGVMAAIARIRECESDIVAKEIDRADFPSAGIARCGEQAFAARNERFRPIK